MSTENDELDDFFREIENVGDSSKNTSNNITIQTNSNSNINSQTKNSNGAAPAINSSSTNSTGIKRKLDDTPTIPTTTTATTTTTTTTTSTNVGVKPMIPPSLMKKKQMISKTSINSNTPSKAVVSSKAVTYSANTIDALAYEKPKILPNYPNLSIATLRPQVTMEEPKKNTNIVMSAVGETWTDHSLSDWDPNDFRLFIGDLGNDVTEEMIRQAFSKYPTFLKAKVVFDKVGKSRGFGFVSFSSSSDYISALNTMNGKYIGNRPIKLRKSKWKDRLASSNK
ncbi:hypothetical protein RB653_004763 [Dictyostelium firmibasis]|uniref:RRM domain-containing protein n=1 Tax=Dictyostelium firmibasis TaxID=79012 RepID=A0AAN7U1J7_9MYCE